MQWKPWIARLVSEADTATKVALLIRSFGRSTVELWNAMPWESFVEMARRLQS
jgi:hypothetical protein